MKIMKTNFPLHSLVATQDLTEDDLKSFPSYEILDLRKVMFEVVGSFRDELQAIIMNELRHRILLKLSLGERVLVTGLDASDIEPLRSLADSQGASFFHWIKTFNQRFPNATVATADEITFTQSLPSKPYEFLKEHWSGITVVGDVHGMMQPFLDAIAWAKSRNHFIWLLGDVIDYGPDSLATMEMAYHLVMRGDGALIIGNHERRIARWLASQQNRVDEGFVKLSDGNKVTTDALMKLSPEGRSIWINRYRSLLGRSSLFGEIKNVVLTHAAVHPSYWNSQPSKIPAIDDYALFGEAERYLADFKRAYTWVDSIPPGRLVMVGHDIRTSTPLNVLGAKGGRAIFMDNGCGKGGKLSSCDLKFGNGGLRIENFNIH